MVFNLIIKRTLLFFRLCMQSIFAFEYERYREEIRKEEVAAFENECVINKEKRTKSEKSRKITQFLL